MRELRLIGVHDDGGHLVLTGDAGDEFRLRIDDRLRAAVRRDRPRVEQREIDPAQVSARDIQALIRAGSTADEVASLTGWELAKIARFEGPVLAERDHVATRAQAVRMRGANQAGAPETLAQRTAARLATRDVDSSTVAWDACRDSEGQWTVSATFIAGGRERAAVWWFDQAGMSVVAKNDEAKWLSEAETAPGPVPETTHRPSDVFDVEVEEERAERANRPQPDDLINSMREHSGAKKRGRSGGRRKPRATESATEEALPFETEETPPAARGTHPKDVPATGDDEAPTQEVPITRPAAAPEEPAPEDSRTGHVGPATDGAESGTTSAADEAPSSAEESTTSGAKGDDAASSEGPKDQAASKGESPKGQAPSRNKGKSKSKRGRASVPSWDDVMFGSGRE